MKSRNSRILIVFAVLSALCLGWVLWRGQDSGRIAPAAPMLRKAPSFDLQDAQGRSHPLAAAEGSVTIVHFWATWCPPCLEELPEWVEFAKAFSLKHAEAPVKWIAISRDENWREALKVFPDQSLPSQMVSLLDDGGKVSDQFGSYQYPETYILNKKHEIVAKWVGPQQWDEKIEEALLKLAAE